MRHAAYAGRISLLFSSFAVKLDGNGDHGESPDAKDARGQMITWEDKAKH
jgi:hypothetical protein